MSTLFKNIFIIVNDIFHSSMHLLKLVLVSMYLKREDLIDKKAVKMSFKISKSINLLINIQDLIYGTLLLLPISIACQFVELSARSKMRNQFGRRGEKFMVLY